MRKFSFAITALLLTMMLLPINVKAAAYTNDTTGYRCLLEDDADLLSPGEEEVLLDDMKPITEYGNVAFKSIASNAATTESYIKSYYRKAFGKASGTVFLIDMDNRNIWIFSDGKIYRTITKSYANTITDNVYTYASKADYYKCANKAFLQMYDLLEGRRIAQPMKYISNALLALAFAFLGNYIRLRIYTHKTKADTSQLIKKMDHHVKYHYITSVLLQTKKVYAPPSSDSDSGGGSYSSSDSGGGSSGGGGGHSF